MRFRALDLIAFGPFTNRSLDLSGGQLGLHLIYGPNEAGKSSSLRALTDFLFGIPARTNDDFTHPYASLRIGGILENQRGEILHCIRRKAIQSSLRDATETKAIDEAQWARFVGDVSREWFTTMFGIDHASLRSGGDTIASGGGTIGEAIFAGASGVVGLRTTQSTLRAKIETLFGPSGRRGTLYELIQQYKSTRDEQKKMSASADQWTSEEKRLRDTEAREIAIRSELEHLKRRRAACERLKTAIPFAAQWNEAQRQLTNLADAPVLPDDFEQSAGQRMERKQVLERVKEGYLSKLQELEANCPAEQDEEHVIALQERIDALVVRSGEYHKGQSDLPRLQSMMQSEEHAARDILRDMGRAPDSDAFHNIRLSRDQQTRIHSLGNRYAALMEKIQSASQRWTRAQRRMSELPSLDADSEATETSLRIQLQRIATTLDQIQQLGPLESKLDSMRRQAHDNAISIANEASRLGIAHELQSRFEAVPLPTMLGLESHANAWQTLRDACKEIALELSRLRKKRMSLEQQVQALYRNRELPTREQWLAVRKERDAQWCSLIDATQKKTPIDPSLLQSFEQRSRAVDDYVERMLDAATELATYEQHQRELASIAQQIQEQETLETAANRSMEAWTDDWRRHWLGVLENPQEPSIMRDWLTRAGELQKRIESRNLELHAMDALEEECGTLRKQILHVLVDAGADVTPDSKTSHLMESARAMLQQSQTQLQRAESLKQQRAAFAEELRDAQMELELAQQAVDDWRALWSNDMAGLGLSSDALPEQALVVLAQLDELTGKWKAASDYRKRIQGIERDADAFLELLHGIAADMRLQAPPTSVQSCVITIKEVLEAAKRQRAHRKMIEQQQRELRGNLETTDSQLKVVEHELQAMMNMACCTQLNELLRSGERSRMRLSYLQQANQLRTQLAGIAAGEPFESFVERATAAEETQLESELSELQKQIESLESERDASIRESARLRGEISKLDHEGMAEELATRASGIATSIEAQFEELVMLRWTAGVLADGIERFRQKHQGPLLSAASEAFRNMTLGRYEGLRVDVDAQGEPILVGVRAGEAKESVAVGQMSDGTRDQLYLSLRIAAIHDWNSRHEPMPFIVDDILIHFDDDRSRATLQQLACMSERTQVLFFTHHQHLIDLASETVPPTQLFVHRL